MTFGIPMIKKCFTSVFSAARRAFTGHGTLVLFLICCVAGSLSLWLYGSGSLKDFGLNAFTESLGIVVTVLVIDRLLKRREEQRILPLQLAAFADVQSFVSGLASMWYNAYNWVGQNSPPPVPEPPPMQRFLTSEYFNILRDRLDLRAKAPVLPEQTWEQYLLTEDRRYREVGERILERHAAVLDPRAYFLVHQVLNGFLAPGTGLQMLPTLKSFGGIGKAEEWEKRPSHLQHVLGRYWFLLDENLARLAELHAWYEEHREEYRQKREAYAA